MVGYLYVQKRQACGCPPTNPACPPQPGCPVHGVATHQAQAIPVPDELEMRAVAFGIPIGQRQHAPTNLEQFEKLVDRQEAIYAATANPVTPLAEDDSELSIGLGSQTEVRRAPAVRVSQQEDAVPENLTNDAAEEEEEELLPTTPIPEATSKCNSQVLKKLMLEVSALENWMHAKYPCTAFPANDGQLVRVEAENQRGRRGEIRRQR
ncbi:hypothetical protein Y032_0106g3763 [Ancylostoma ceylanicum]|uniref:Uncharacterized protein n=1 Tax=Ancylostoma ceylanicum TaxID=53326 RepID=A0A016TFV8_9BILA|nr:hypothetical protein Y032_0106g3763 [Ancylostoma ceylanicum]